MIKVINAELKNEYKILVEFNNGIKGIIDFRNILEEDHRKIIKELLNMDLFRTVKVKLNTLCWDNDVDFAPDYLYEQIKIRENGTCNNFCVNGYTTRRSEYGLFKRSSG